MAKRLLENGTQNSINLADNEGITPLLWAAGNNNPAMAKRLLNKGIT